MTSTVAQLAESMEIFKKYNPEATLEFWDGYMVVFGKEVGEISDEDKLRLLQMRWKEPEDESEVLSRVYGIDKELPDYFFVWEYGLG